VRQVLRATLEERRTREPRTRFSQDPPHGV
jgi:hypothetical protein